MIVVNQNFQIKQGSSRSETYFCPKAKMLSSKFASRLWHYSFRDLREYKLEGRSQPKPWYISD